MSYWLQVPTCWSNSKLLPGRKARETRDPQDLRDRSGPKLTRAVTASPPHPVSPDQQRAISTTSQPLDTSIV
jgi:hypothetical protein